MIVPAINSNEMLARRLCEGEAIVPFLVEMDKAEEEAQKGDLAQTEQTANRTRFSLGAPRLANALTWAFHGLLLAGSLGLGFARIPLESRTIVWLYSAFVAVGTAIGAFFGFKRPLNVRQKEQMVKVAYAIRLNEKVKALTKEIETKSAGEGTKTNSVELVQLKKVKDFFQAKVLEYVDRCNEEDQVDFCKSKGAKVGDKYWDREEKVVKELTALSKPSLLDRISSNITYFSSRPAGLEEENIQRR